MRHPLAMILAVGFLAANPGPGRAEHAKINLDVTASGEQVTAFVDQTPPEHGKNPRPVIKAKVGEPIKVQFTLTNVYPHKTLENVVVHFYIARQGKAGQKPTPDLGAEGVVVLESAFEMDFKPGAKAGDPEHPPDRQARRLPRPRRVPPDRERPRALRRDR